MVFPTVAHSHAESTRPEHAELLALGLPDVSDSSVTVRVDLEVVEAIAVHHPERIAELEPFHIWTTDSVQRNRIDFRPRRELTAIVVRARPMVRPVEVALTAEYGGCRSWVDLPEPTAGFGDLLRPVLEDRVLLDIADRVRAVVG